MPRSKPNAALRSRIETGIAIAAPVLDLVLAVGDRVSRVLGSDEPDHVPARVDRRGEYAARGLGPRGQRR
jgi:hypothetical protein